MTKAKVFLGLAVMLILQIVAGQVLPSFDGDNTDLDALKSAITVHASLASFIGAFAAGWVARRRFLLPSLILWLFIWVAMIYLLYSIVELTGQASLLSIIQPNLVTLIFSGFATALGAVFGQLIVTRRSRGSATAT